MTLLYIEASHRDPRKVCKAFWRREVPPTPEEKLTFEEIILGALPYIA